MNGMEFCNGGVQWRVFEKIVEILRDQHENKTEKLIFIKDKIANYYEWW